jgi:hypothetical protein
MYIVFILNVKNSTTKKLPNFTEKSKNSRSSNCFKGVVFHVQVYTVAVSYQSLYMN